MNVTIRKLALLEEMLKKEETENLYCSVPSSISDPQLKNRVSEIMNKIRSL